jgi:hypothetical protein
MRRPAWLAVACGAALLAGCTGGSTPRAATHVSRSASPRPITPVEVQRYGGWDQGEFVFRTSWTVYSNGTVAGKMTVADVSDRSTLTNTVQVHGYSHQKARDPSARRVILHLSRPAFGGLTELDGAATQGELTLEPHDPGIEDYLTGSPTSIGYWFKRHVAILRGPGGYDGWRTRRVARQAVVRRVDIDGDGRKDLVTVVWRHLLSWQAHAGTREVFVRLASGDTLTYDVEAGGGWESHDPLAGAGGGPLGWAGTIHLPGIPGRQVVLLTDTGASNTFYTVLADLDGTLTSIEPPPPNTGWNEGGSVGVGVGEDYCPHGVLLSAYVTFHGRAAQRAHLRADTYVWRDGAWLTMSRYSGAARGYPRPKPEDDSMFSGCDLRR